MAKKVISSENGENLSIKAKNTIDFKNIGISLLCSLIIIATAKYEVDKHTTKNSDAEVDKTISSQVKIEGENNTTVEIQTESVEIEDNKKEKVINDFYNEILSYKSIYGEDFAIDINSTQDVEKIYNFISMFNETEKLGDMDIIFKDADSYNNTIINYYNSCVKYGIKPSLSSLMYNDYFKNIVSESESIASNLDNGSSDNYALSNEYYEWYGINLCDMQSAINCSSRANAPVVQLLIDQYIVYRNVGNMESARYYEKNDCLNINGNVNFACPNAIDQTMIDKDVEKVIGNERTFERVYVIIDEECNSLNKSR